MEQKLTPFEEKIVATWEDVYKKGQLTLWILLSLKAGPKHMTEMKEFIASVTNATFKVDDQSLYRALRRFHKMDLVAYREEPSVRGGPKIKVYSLTPVGRHVLEGFVERNITNVLYTSKVRSLLHT
ncbi:MAG: PadR family transcriptional regulator [Candidatus Spechtbacterales bacterium]